MKNKAVNGSGAAGLLALLSPGWFTAEYLALRKAYQRLRGHGQLVHKRIYAIQASAQRSGLTARE